jgi:hypothetical protein
MIATPSRHAFRINLSDTIHSKFAIIGTGSFPAAEPPEKKEFFKG